MNTFRVGDVVEVASGAQAGRRGRVTALHGSGKLEVELADPGGVLRGLKFWLSIEDVLAGGPRSRVKRARPSRVGREIRIEVRPVCRHIQIANLCPDCLTSRRR